MHMPAKRLVNIVINSLSLVGYIHQLAYFGPCNSHHRIAYDSSIEVHFTRETTPPKVSSPWVIVNMQMPKRTAYFVQRGLFRDEFSMLMFLLL